MRLRIVLAFNAAIALVLAAVCAAANDVADCTLRSVDKTSYVGKNEDILQRLPVFPGAKLLTGYSIGHTASDTCLPIANGAPYGSFTTTHVYKVGKPSPRGAIVRYYRKRLLAQGWRWVARSGLTGPPLDSAFRRGPASLYISESYRGSWIITTDHAAYRRLKKR
jgi:hypothetical protein